MNADAALDGAPADRAARGGVTVARIAFRNLWRQPRRTWTAVAGIAFTVALLMFSVSIQGGTYPELIDNATALLTGHIQVQHPDFEDDPDLAHRFGNVTARLAAVREDPAVVAASPRAQAHALVAADRRSFAGLVLGVDPAGERRVSSLDDQIREGRYLEGGDEAVLGWAMARNLGVGLGDEVVVLGTGADRGVAAAALTVTGIFDTGQTELDRSLIEIPIDTFRTAFGLEDEAHTLVIRLTDAGRAQAVAARLDERLDDGVAVLPWQQLMPEVEQLIALDRASSRIFYGLLVLMVTLSLVNTVIMVIFERTREFGMLLAVGMRPHAIIAMLQLEVLWTAVLGVAIGMVLGVGAILVMGEIGIYMGAGSEALLAQYHLPERLYPRLTPAAFGWGPLAMMVLMQIAALAATQRVRRLTPVAALRSE